MGQQSSFPLGAEWRSDAETCARRIQVVEGLLSDPDQLRREGDSHFSHAGLNARGELRRVELRRLLVTLARNLGSEKLTWEDIEAAAIVGTVEPSVPTVSSEEFFKCLLKTVHLVAAELRQNLKLLEAELRAKHRMVADQFQGSASRTSSCSSSSPPGKFSYDAESPVSQSASVSSDCDWHSQGLAPDFAAGAKGRGKISTKGLRSDIDDRLTGPHGCRPVPVSTTAGSKGGFGGQVPPPASSGDFPACKDAFCGKDCGSTSSVAAFPFPADASASVQNRQAHGARLMSEECRALNSVGKASGKNYSKVRGAPVLDQTANDLAEVNQQPTTACQPDAACRKDDEDGPVPVPIFPEDCKSDVENNSACLLGDQATSFHDDEIPDEQAALPISQMYVPGQSVMALMANSEGELEQQQLRIDSGVLVVSDPENATAGFFESLWGSRSNSVSMELTQLQAILTGQKLAYSPVFSLVRDIAGADCAPPLDMMLVLIFPGEELLCFLFHSPEVCASFAFACEQYRGVLLAASNPDDEAEAYF